MILVTGAAGKTGQAVIRALDGRGAAVRAWVRRPEQMDAVEALGARETIAGDIQSPLIWAQATSGVRSIYHICPNMYPYETTVGAMALQAARRAGISHFVYHSVLHPQTEEMPHHWHKLRVEEWIFESGLDFTILQPAAYMQNVLAYWSHIVEDGIYPVPYPVDTPMSLVDLGDVAAVVAAVLTEEGHTGAIYELAGPQILTQRQIAAILGEHLDRPVEAQEVPLDEWEANARRAGLSDFAVDSLLRMFRYYARHGFWGNANVLRWLLGREPTTLAQRVGDWRLEIGD
jgi:NAD(P)H dehydrogenase (quinone)